MYSTGKLWLGNKDGSGFTLSTQSLNILAPVTDINITDFDGDGYVDVVSRFGRKGDNFEMLGGQSAFGGGDLPVQKSKRRNGTGDQD